MSITKDLWLRRPFAGIPISAYSAKLASGTPILIGLLVLLLLGYGLQFFAPVDPAIVDPAVADKFISPLKVHPKPHDRFVFQAIVIVGFVALACISALWRRHCRSPADPRAVFLICAVLVVAIALSVGLWAGLLQLFAGPHLTGTVLCLTAAAAIAGVSTYHSADYSAEKSRKWLLIATFAIAGSFIVATRLFTDSTIAYSPYISSHYEAVVYSIVYISGGGTCLAGFVPQYGCYGEFLAPVVQLTGASPFALTAIFAALQSLALLAIIIFAASLIRTTAILLAAIGCIVILMDVILALGSPDPFFQYNPIRLLFPALSLVCVLAAQKSPSLKNMAALGIFAGASAAWNLDTGVAVIGALAFFSLTIGFTDTSLPSMRVIPALKRVTSFVAGVTLFLAAFAFYLEVKSGWSVDFSRALSVQNAFYFAGFSMIPIPPFPDLWTIAAIIICVTLTASLLMVSSRDGTDTLIERAAYLAILAIGLMLYYTGRSHLLVLVLVVWPEVILFYFLADRALQVSGRPASVLVVCASVFLPLASATYYFPVWSEVAVDIWRRPAPQSNLVSEDISFLKHHIAPGERVGIIAENQTTLYVATGTRPSVKGPSLAEFQLWTDLASMKSELAESGPEKLFVNPVGTSLAFSSTFLGLKDSYDLVESGPGGRLLFLTRRHHL